MRPRRPQIRSTSTRLPPPSDSADETPAAGQTPAERFRRRGVAAALLEEAERAALAQGLSSVSLDTRSSNMGARALYERHGYEVHVEVPASRPIPALVGYVKRLG